MPHFPPTQPWPAITGLAYGGDYNPEQWPRETWLEDVRLMREAGVTLVSVGIFSWALIETDEGQFDFSWLDEVLDLLHGSGIAVDLGTPTASPPAWFFHRYPESRVTTADGTRLGFGSRGMVSPSSPAYREAIVRIASALAERYAHHPAVVMWHVHNEYGAPVFDDHSETTAQAFRDWLRERYGSLDALNAAWGTAFWGQHYGRWEYISTPAVAPSVVNPAQKLDFHRFSDHQLRQCFLAERDAIRQHAAQPITTNFMANQHGGCDLWEWAKHVDVVSDDHYLVAADEHPEIGLAIAADLTRSVAGGMPWMLMEHSTSGINWQPTGIAKRPGEMARNSLAHVARGADAVMFFQWRASRRGAEKFHSAMLPHAGTTSRIWQEVTQLGADLTAIADLQGSRVKADVAILWDYESFWAQDLEWRPVDDLDHNERVRAFYERLWRDGVTTDFALPSHDLSRYRVVVAPAQYLLRQADAENLTRFVEQGGTLVVSYFSAVVDEHDAVSEGGFLASLRTALGVEVHEHLPLRRGTTANLQWENGTVTTSDHWQEDLRLRGADVVAHYADGPAAGAPAVTRQAHGSGAGWYISTRLDAEALTHVFDQVYAEAGLSPTRPPRGLEVVRREGPRGSYTIAINHAENDADIATPGTDLLTQETGRTFCVPAGGVRIIHET
ncbi:beta-galactosidase [Microbacterium amylolyticum]|uniref:Beta-galactosidase n=1 Tax=Microbacterium amylolyticum TaxID=936337 RepID=A0ABS4ZKY8_9MICO|nr:beta-galactosidase [Microbacterium amylolyticum]MBP2437663.1 beta-galactosidase [Microbacterium amylolyticum]